MNRCISSAINIATCDHIYSITVRRSRRIDSSVYFTYYFDYNYTTMVLKFSDPRLMHRTVPSGVDISAEYMFDETPQEDSPISRHFRGRKVLVTGITGFLGPLFLEKLLRVGADRVYVLCRAKAGLSAEERVERVFQEPVSARLLTLDLIFTLYIIVMF